MNYRYPCPHCEAVTVIAENADFDGACTSCGRSVFQFPDEGPNEKAPATAPTVNEGTKHIPAHSVTTAYLLKASQNTGHAFGTWSGAAPTFEDHVAIIIPLEAARGIFADGPQLVGFNPECVAAQSAVARKAREEREEKKLKDLRRKLSRQISEEEGFRGTDRRPRRPGRGDLRPDRQEGRCRPRERRQAMTLTELIAHIVFFAGPGVLVLAWQEINDLPMKRWSHGSH